jgi:hypothetical protein
MKSFFQEHFNRYWDDKTDQYLLASLLSYCKYKNTKLAKYTETHRTTVWERFLKLRAIK